MKEPANAIGKKYNKSPGQKSLQYKIQSEMEKIPRKNTINKLHNYNLPRKIRIFE